jgi:hypothetical protein
MASETGDGSGTLNIHPAQPYTEGGPPRYCAQLDGVTDNTQSCFPLSGRGLTKWLYVEYHDGRTYLIGAVAAGDTVEIAPTDGTPPFTVSTTPITRDFHAFVVVLDRSVNVTVAGTAERETFYDVNRFDRPGGLPRPANGERSPISYPALPGVHPEFHPNRPGLGTPNTTP